MDSREIQKWLSDPHERVVFIEEGKPAFVAMGFEAYQRLKGQHHIKDSLPVAFHTGAQEELINAELEAERLRARELAAKMAMDTSREERGGGEEAEAAPRIRLEDLPL
jgi:PHD/YefM family antitoxin component YafN of YafNO toxin-antitoxin module